MRKEERKKEKSPLVIFVVVASKAPQCSGFDCKESPKKQVKQSTESVISPNNN